jgi:rhodanese-related sulfurtransferase
MGLLAKLIRLLRPEPLSVMEPQELAAKLRARARPMVLDVRGQAEFSGELGHIRGAVNMPLPRLLATPRTEFAPNTGEVVLVCRSDMRARRAARYLRRSGLAKVVVLRGGMLRWRELRLPTA